MPLIVVQAQGNKPTSAFVSRGVCADWEAA